MFNVRYIASACLVVSTPDVRILCDPWFTEGIYDGSWYTFPKIQNPLELIGDVDVVYISHIHPDHYDPTFLHQYFKRYGVKQLLIPNLHPNYLLHKTCLDGLQATTIESLEIGNTTVSIVPNSTSSTSDIDSALVVTHSGISFLNLNDNIFNHSQNEALHSLLSDLRFAAIGYSPAGPYPQTYFSDQRNLVQESLQQKNRAIQKFLAYLDEFKPHAALPFAGQYLLGGRLHTLNEYRGCPDAVELLDLDPRVVVLSDSPDTYYDLEKQRVVGTVRTMPFETSDVVARISEISQAKLSYEVDFNIELSRLPISRLLKAAYYRAHKKSECEIPAYFFIQTSLGERGWLLSADRKNEHFEDVTEPEAIAIAQTCSAELSILTIDYRLLFGLITGVYHWNNAEVGSLFQTRRSPNRHNRAAQRFLYYLNIA